MKLEDVSEFVRSLVRPVISVGIVAAMALFAWNDKIDPEILATLGAAVTAFWFATRTKEKSDG